MPLALLKSINAKIDDDGIISLEDPQKHGCVVFNPANDLHFELEFTAQQDDPWHHKAGAYCVGVIDFDEVESIEAPYYDDTDTYCVRFTMSMNMTNMGKGGSMSTGTLSFQHDLFETDPYFQTKVFEGYLKQNQSLIMHCRKGNLGYRLGEHMALTDVTKFLWASDGKGKGKHGNHKDGEEQRGFVPCFVPCIWIFAQEVPEQYANRERQYASYKKSAAKVNLRSWIHSCMHPLGQPSTKRMKALWDDRRFTDCKIECCGAQIAAHRAILCKASPLLDAAFSGPWKEGEEAVYKIQNRHPLDAVRAIIEFMYTENLRETEVETLIAMLPLAVYFQLDELCTTIASLLIDDLAAENVKDVAEVIKRYGNHASLTWAKADFLGRLKREDHLLAQVI